VVLGHRGLCAGLCLGLIAIAGCNDPNRYAAWNGTWKLNVAESQAHNYLLISFGPDGVATVTTEGMDFRYRCDGTAISMGQGRTGFCNPVNEVEWKIDSFTRSNSPHITRRLAKAVDW
jgi:hypothetical protein